MAPLYQAAVAGSQAESTLYGICILLFPTTIFVFRQRMLDIPVERRRTQHVVMSGTILLFVFITIHWFLGVLNIDFSDKPSLNFTSVINPALLGCEFLVIDALLIYRLWIVWERSLAVVALPILCFVGGIGTTIVLAISIAVMDPNAPYTAMTIGSAIALFGCSLATNVQAVGLIAYKILVRGRTIRVTYSPLVMIIVESAALLALVNIIIAVAIVTGSDNTLSVMIQLASPISGICLCMITLRIGLAKYVPALRDDTSVTVRRSMAPIIPMSRMEQSDPNM